MTVKETPGVDVLCPRCGRMLAKRLPSGALDLRRNGVRFAIIAVGAVICRFCPGQHVKADYMRVEKES